MKARFFFIIASALLIATSAIAQTREIQVYKGGNVIKFFSFNEVDSAKVVYTAKNMTATAVDLGLSVKWADMNVGAGRPEDYGSYFAWGETAPKREYTWNTYTWCEGSNTTMTKYCNDSSYGIEDYLSTLEAADDAAHENWGGAWRMPTESELDELLSNCTWKWVTQDGVNGQLVTGPNGNSIFLPATGWIDNLARANAGSYGCYYSSALSSERSDRARAMYISNGGSGLYDASRISGYAVRPVLPSTAYAKAPELQVFKGNDLVWSIAVSEIDSAKVVEIPVHAVDMGLSVFWADMNVGAEKPEEYGNYYSWGETRPKDDYSFTNYQWWDNGFTKYCTNDEHGTTDHKSILDLSDDAANANWGSTWRTPTIEEIRELANRCQWHWTERNGVEGFQVTGPSGNSIFLPPAGYYEGSEGKNVNRHGLYWSSTLYTYYLDYKIDQCAHCLFINNDYMEYRGIDAIERFKGFPVRPVIKIR